MNEIHEESLLSLMQKRRSVRSHRPDPISKEVIQSLLEAARWAPSGGNKQTWRFFVVQDPVQILKIQAISPGLLGKPTALIVICSEQDLSDERSAELDRECALIETGLAAQNIMLAATAMELGSCPCKSFHAGGLRLLLRLPPTIQPHLIISLGYPRQEVPPTPRRPLEDLVHWERYAGEAREFHDREQP